MNKSIIIVLSAMILSVMAVTAIQSHEIAKANAFSQAAARCVNHQVNDSPVLRTKLNQDGTCSFVNAATGTVILTK